MRSKFIFITPVFFHCLTFTIACATPSFASANTSGVQYVSEIDKQVEVRRVLALPLADNVAGIYANGLAETFIQSAQAGKIWDVQTDPSLKNTLEELEDNPSIVQDLGKRFSVQAILAGRINKGPKGLQIKLVLFLTGDGEAFILENSSEDQSTFELSEVRKSLDQLVRRLRKRMPYDGLILSRRGQTVTLNLGSAHGLVPQNTLNIVQIFKLNRHPRFGFMVGVEKTLMGEIIITQVDEFLSFGQIISEREPNVIAVGSKIVLNEFVKTPSPTFDDQGNSLKKPVDGVAFGPEPREWKPVTQPTFGKLGLLLGLGSYAMNNSLDVGTANTNQGLVPSIMLQGELWFDPNWFADLNLRQASFRIANAYPGESTPSRLSVSSSIYTMLFGYNFLVQDQFHGPKFRLGLGMGRMNTTVDNSSPTAFTSVSYGGTVIAVGGSFPITLESKREFIIGGDLYYYWRPSMSEGPVYSGEVSGNQVSSYAAHGTYRFNHRMGVKGSLNFDFFASSLSGSGSRANSATSISQSMTNFYGGLEFLF